MSGSRIKVLLKTYWWWVILAILLYFLHISHPLDSDEGIVLNGAWNIINGKKLYSDFFEFVSPGSFYSLAAWWKIFPVTYESAKALGLLLIFSGAIGVFQLGRLVGFKKLTWYPPLLFVLASGFWGVITYNIFVLPFLIWSAVIYLRVIKNPKDSKLFFLSGILIGTSIVFLQHKGIYLSVFYTVFSLFLIWKKTISFTRLLFLILGIILPTSLLFLFWSPALLFQNLIIFPLHHYPETNTVPLYVWLFILFLSLLLFLKTKRNKDEIIVTYLFSLQVFLLLTVLGRADIYHIIHICFPLYVLLTLFFSRIDNNSRWYSLLVLVLVSSPINFLLLTAPQPLLQKPSADLYNLTTVHCPSYSLYAGPFSPNLYFELRRLNPTPYSFLITNQQTPEQFEEAAEILISNPPQCAILHYGLVEKFNYSKNNPVDTFLLGHYRLEASLPNGFDLYTLR